MSRPWWSGWTRERWNAAYSYERRNGYDRYNRDGLNIDTLFIHNLGLDWEGHGGDYETGPWWFPLRQRLSSIGKFDRNSFLWPGPDGRLP